RERQGTDGDGAGAGTVDLVLLDLDRGETVIDDGGGQPRRHAAAGQADPFVLPEHAVGSREVDEVDLGRVDVEAHGARHQGRGPYALGYSGAASRAALGYSGAASWAAHCRVPVRSWAIPPASCVRRRSGKPARRNSATSSSGAGR